MRYSQLPAILGLAVAAAQPVVAQDAPPEFATVAQAVEALKADLRNYIVAQEAYFADHRAYALSVQRTPFEPSAGVTVVVLTAFGPDGHSAIAIHASVPGLVCAVWVGVPPPPIGNGGQEGEPMCRLPS